MWLLDKLIIHQVGKFPTFLYKPWVRETLTLNLILNHINPMLILTRISVNIPSILTYFFTYVLHGAESFLRS